jgi:hypothetical protein
MIKLTVRGLMNIPLDRCTATCQESVSCEPMISVVAEIMKACEPFLFQCSVGHFLSFV